MSQKKAKQIRKLLKNEGIDVNVERKYFKHRQREKLYIDKDGKPAAIVSPHIKECVSLERKVYQDFKRIIKTGQESQLRKLPNQDEFLEWRKEYERITTEHTAAEKSLEATTEGELQSQNEENGSSVELSGDRESGESLL